MHEAIQNSERTIAVLSPSYLNAHFTHSEWAAAFGQDPTSNMGVLLPIRVEECDPKGLLGQIIYLDLVGKKEDEARVALLSGIKTERAKPLTKPEFPQAQLRSVSEQPAFPGTDNRWNPARLILLVALGLLLPIAGYVYWADPRSPMPTRPCEKPLSGKYYEAEAAELSGAASQDKEHSGYSGEAYVSGFGHGHPGTAVTFWIDVPLNGQYPVQLCYANGTGSTKTLSIYLNDARITQTRLRNHQQEWNSWLIQTEFLPLRSGRNAITYRKDSLDSGEVNLDFIRIAQSDMANDPKATP